MGEAELGIPESRYPERIERARAALRERGLAALVIHSAASELFMQTSHQAYARYLLGLTSRFAPMLLVLGAEGGLIVGGTDSMDVEYLPALRPWLRDVRTTTPYLFGQLARQALRSLGVGRGPVGLIGGDDLPRAAFADLVDQPGELDFRPAHEVIDRLRLTKEPEEIALHRRAARLVDAMYGTLLEGASREGQAAAATQVEMEYTARRAGAERATSWLTTGESLMRVPFRDQHLGLRFERGRQVVCGTYAIYQGYYGHAIRMGFKGVPTRESERLYAVIRAAQEAAMAEVRPGGGTAAVRLGAEEVLAREFPPDPYRFRVAHFLGIEYSEPPTDRAFPQPWSLTLPPPPQAPEDIPLEPGMVLEIHPNLRVPGLGYCALGDMVLVTETGHERLTGFPREHFVVD